MKKTTAVFTVMTLFIVTVFSLHAKDRKGHSVLGELTKIEEKSITFFKPRKNNNESFTIIIKEDTVIEINGQKGSLTDLKVGMQVIVDVNEKDKTAYSVTFREKKKKGIKKDKKKMPEDNN